VCVSRDVADFASSEMGLPEDKLAVIPNGVDLERFPAAKRANLASLGVPPGRRLVTFIGRLECQKGVEWLLESSSNWLQRLPIHDLLLIGRGRLAGEFRRICYDLGIRQRVHVAGWRADVPEVLGASDLLVLPSEWEGMPNVVLEAMATGLPVVASDVEGIRELLGGKAAMQTVRFGDSGALTDRIVQLLSDPTLAAELGAANRRRVEEHFGLDSMVEAYQRLWESLLS
jgi:starch synthase (maltosyl-transferring)